MLYLSLTGHDPIPEGWVNRRRIGPTNRACPSLLLTEKARIMRRSWVGLQGLVTSWSHPAAYAFVSALRPLCRQPEKPTTMRAAWCRSRSVRAVRLRPPRADRPRRGSGVTGSDRATRR